MQEGSREPASPSVVLDRHNETSLFGLTTAQISIWFDQSLHPGKPIYNTGQLISISGHLDVARFDCAMRQVILENDALRLRFIQKDGRVFQEIVPEVVTALNYRDFAGDMDPAGQAAAWFDRIFWTALRASDFPLLEFAVARIAADQFLWLQKYHHLIIDATGRQLVAARVAAAYNSLSERQERAKSIVSFHSAKAAEDDYLASPPYSADESYWKERLRDLPTACIKTDKRWSERSRSGRPARLDFDLGLDASAKLRSFARAHNSSAFKVVLCLVWSCYRNMFASSDVIVGVPVANRRSEGAKECVGLFAKMFPFRLCLDASMSLAAALSELDARFAEDIRHQLFPLNHTIRAMDFRATGRSELFDLAVNYVRSDYGFTIGGAPITCKNLSSGFPVAFSVTIFDHGETVPIRVVLDTDPGRIPAVHAAAFLECLKKLLSAPLQGSERLEELSAELAAGAFHSPEIQSPSNLPASPARISMDPMPPGDKFKPPGDEIELILLNMWRDRLQMPNATISDDYFDLGGNSLKAMELVLQCNETFGTDLPISAVFEFPTVAEMANAVRAATVVASRKCVVQLKAGSVERCCVLAHAIGGTLFCYNELISHLNGPWPIYGLQPANLSSFAPTSVEEIARDYLAALDQIIGDVPRYFAGWSFGGVVAFEMARQYNASARPLLGVTLIDTPCHAEFWEGDDDRDILSRAARLLGIGAQIEPSANGAACASAIIQSAAACAGAPVPAARHVEDVVDLIRNIRRIRRKYRPARLPTSVTLFRAEAEPKSQEQAFDWSDYVEGDLNVVRLTATHESILKFPHVRSIAAHLDSMCSRDFVA